jgi:RecB family exonuclease
MRASSKASAQHLAQRKPTLSPTRIATYLECAVKYRYVYIDKIGRFYLRARPYYSFGSTLHQILQDYHEEGGIASAEQVVENLDRSWIAAGYESELQEAEHREAGEQIVHAYVEAHRERAETQIETLWTEKTISWDMGRFRLSGRVDRVDRHPDGRLEIIDYKSGHRVVTEADVASDLAMCCYQLILARMNPGVPVSGTIYSLRTGDQASAALTAERLDAFEADIRALGAEILDRDYDLLLPVRMPCCDDCDFLRRCERVWRQQTREQMEEPFYEDG